MEQIMLRADDVNTPEHSDLAARRYHQATVLRTLKNSEIGGIPSACGENNSLSVGVVHGGESFAPQPCTDAALPGRERSTPMSEIETFVPGLVAHSLAQPGLPTQRELAVLFVDIADSTRTVVRQSPEVALATVQRFMRLVTEIALAHCG